MLAKGIGKVKGLMDNPLFNLVGTAINPVGGAVKGLAGLANRFLPVNTRAIQEGIAGNLGIRVDDIGRIVNTGNYLDPNNIMAGYNLSLIDDDTFEKRIDRINKGGLSAKKKAERIALIRKAQEKIMASQKLADEARKQKELEKQQKELARQLARAQREIEAKGYQDYGSGAASEATQRSYEGPDGSYAGASTQDYGSGE